MSHTYYISRIRELEDDIALLKVELEMEKQRSAELKRRNFFSYMAVLDLFFALRAIGGKPTLRDLLKLAKRLKSSFKEGDIVEP